MAFVLLMFPEMTSAPPAAWVKVAVVPALPPRMIGALIVSVPLALSTLIALVVPVPMLVSVSAGPLLERMYPGEEMANVKPWIVSATVRFGLITLAPENVALSLTPGTMPPIQLGPALKSLPELFHVIGAACVVDVSSPPTIAVPKTPTDTVKTYMRLRIEFIYIPPDKELCRASR